MEQMHADISAMRSALQLQVNVCADLRAITMDVISRVCNPDVTGNGGRDVCGSALEVTWANRAAACEEGGEASVSL